MTIELVRLKTESVNKEVSSGFGIVEVIVSIFLLGILGMLIAAGLIQAIIANARNTFIVAVSQRTSEEIVRLQAVDWKCSEINSLLSAAPTTITPPISPNETVTISFAKVGTWSCNSTVSTYYPIKVMATNRDNVVFSSEFMVGTVKESSG